MIKAYMKKTLEKYNYAFIDSQNLYLGVKSQGWKLDWRKFRQYLRNKYNVIKAYFFIGQVAGNESLYTFLYRKAAICLFLNQHWNFGTKVKSRLRAMLMQNWYFIR